MILVRTEIFESMYVSGKLSTYPSPNLTLTLTSRFGQNARFGEGKVGSFPETYIEPTFFLPENADLFQK